MTVLDQETPAQSVIVQMEPLAVSVEEAAALLSLGRTTVYELLNAGEIPSFRVGKARRVPIEGLREWVRRVSEAT